MLSFVPGVLLAILVSLVLLLASTQASGADQTGYASIMFMLVVLAVLSELVALGLGIAGALQRQRKRTFAFLGIACSVLVLVLGYVQDVILPVWM